MGGYHHIHSYLSTLCVVIVYLDPNLVVGGLIGTTKSIAYLSNFSNINFLGVKAYHPFWTDFSPFEKHCMPNSVLYNPYEVWATRALCTKYSMLLIYLCNVLLQYLCALLIISLTFNSLTHIILISH
jgi:hypothetical protein